MSVFNKAKTYLALQELESETLKKFQFEEDKKKLVIFLKELLEEELFERLKPVEVREKYEEELVPSCDGRYGRYLEFSLVNKERNRRANLKAKIASDNSYCIIYYRNSWLDIGSSVFGMFDETGQLLEVCLKDKYDFVLFLERKLSL